MNVVPWNSGMHPYVRTGKYFLRSLMSADVAHEVTQTSMFLMLHALGLPVVPEV